MFSEEGSKKKYLDLKIKSKKQPSDMRQHFYFSRKKEVFLVKKQPFIFTVYNLLQAHPPFPCQRYDFPSSCNVSGKLQPHQKRFMDVWEQQIKQNEQKKKAVHTTFRDYSYFCVSIMEVIYLLFKMFEGKFQTFPIAYGKFKLGAADFCVPL